MPKHSKSKSRSSSSISNPSKNSSGRPAKIKKVKEVVFDEEKRKEFLTGFSKRKKARETAVRNKAIERERQELREMRHTIREERKERAAHNVKQARELYGDVDPDEEQDSDDDFASEGDDDHEATTAGPTTFESSELVTTVAIEPFSLSRSPTPENLPPLDANVLRASTSSSAHPKAPSHKRRVKNKPAARLKMTREDKKERAKGSKKVKAKFAKQNTGTKGRSNKG